MPDEEGIVFSPETFAEHDGALSYIRRLSRTRSPLGRQKRYPRVIPGYWGKLAAGATITAASGLSLGSGTVKLCDREGTVFDEDESVGVANAGKVLTAGVSGAVVPLEWTDGEWSTCVCGPASVVVPPASCDECFGAVGVAPLTVTDSNATFTAAFVSSFPQRWHGSYTKSATGANSVTGSPSDGYTYAIGPITLGIGYNISCGGGDTPKLIVARGWNVLGVDDPFVYCGDPPAPQYIYADVSLGPNYCVGSPFGVNPTTDSKNANLLINNCDPLDCSGLLTTGSPHTADPAPGLVTLTNTPRWLMERWLDDPDPDRRRHARYRLMIMDNPHEPPGVLYADGTYVPGNPDGWTPPTREDDELRGYVERHGCCG